MQSHLQLTLDDGDSGRSLVNLFQIGEASEAVDLQTDAVQVVHEVRLLVGHLRHVSRLLLLQDRIGLCTQHRSGGFINSLHHHQKHNANSFKSLANASKRTMDMRSAMRSGQRYASHSISSLSRGTWTLNSASKANAVRTSTMPAEISATCRCHRQHQHPASTRQTSTNTTPVGSGWHYNEMHTAGACGGHPGRHWKVDNANTHTRARTHTTQHNTTQHNTTQHNTTQHNTHTPSPGPCFGTRGWTSAARCSPGIDPEHCRYRSRCQ
jgi:hypothetical protein